MRPSLTPPDEPAAFLIRHLVILRRQKQISLHQMARALGVSATRLSQFEHLKYQPNASQLVRWARLLGRDLIIVMRPEQTLHAGQTRWSDYDTCHHCAAPALEPCWNKAHLRHDTTNRKPVRYPHEGRALWTHL